MNDNCVMLKLVGTLFVLVFLLVEVVVAQNQNSLQPEIPLVLTDYEDETSIELWTGLACEITKLYASSGRNGMKFVVPKWNEGDEERPAVFLSYDGGKGFPFQDWSAYGSVIVDIWIDGDSPASPGIQLRDTRGRKSWTVYDTFEPGKPNQLELSIDDAAADIDIHQVNQVVFYDLRPDVEYTVTVDHLRLLPREKPPVASFQLLYPNYRNSIRSGDEEIIIEVKPAFAVNGYQPDSLEWQLSLNGSGWDHKETVSVGMGQTLLSIPCADAPEGELTLRAELYDNKSEERLAKSEWTLEKSGDDNAVENRVWIDRHNNTIVNGEPFFPLGWFSNTSLDYLDEVADSPFNCILAYGTNHVSKDDMTRYLDKMHEKGLKLIYCMNDVYPTAKYFDEKDWHGVSGNENIATAVVDAYKNHPALLAWYLNDELPRDMVPKLEGYYDHVKNADPSHPCYIVLCQRKDLPYFCQTTDVMGVDPYPIPHDPIVFVNEMMDKAQEAVDRVMPVWAVLQSFGWYQYNSPNPDRGHIPTKEELLKGRAPTYEEQRCMTYLALTHGAKGIIYYCYYDFRVLPQYEVMWEWMKDIASEVKELSPILLSPDDLGTVMYEPKEAEIHTKLKRYNGKLYLIAVNSGNETVSVKFDLQQELSTDVVRMFENGSLNINGNWIQDSFDPLEAHVYDLGRDIQ